MARLPRLYAPGVVQYVLQRPAAGRAFFADADDYRFFIALLGEAARAESVALHAYVLLPVELRLLATPPGLRAIGRLMQAIGRRYTPYLNRRSGRGGPLWDRRYRSALIDADALLLPSMRHIEQRPVVLSLAEHVQDWPWSSYAHHAGTAQQAFVSDHARYWSLSDTPFARQAAYRRLVDAPQDEAEVRRIERATELGWAVGDPAWEARIGDLANRRAAPLPRGRKPG